MNLPSKYDPIEYYINLVPEKDDHFAHIISEIFGPDIGGIIMRFIPQVRSNVTNAEMVAAANMGDYRTFICGVFQYCQGLYPAIEVIIKNRTIYMVDLVITLIKRWENQKLLRSKETLGMLTHMVLCATRLQDKKYALEIYKKVDRKITIPCDYMIDKTKPNAEELAVKLQCKLPFIHRFHADQSKYFIKNSSVAEGNYLDQNSLHGCALHIRLSQDWDILTTAAPRIVNDLKNVDPDLKYGGSYNKFIFMAAWDRCSLKYLMEIFEQGGVGFYSRLLTIALRNNDIEALKESLENLRSLTTIYPIIYQELVPWMSVECIKIIIKKVLVDIAGVSGWNYGTSIIFTVIRYGYDIIPFLDELVGREEWIKKLDITSSSFIAFRYAHRYITNIALESEDPNDL